MYMPLQWQALIEEAQEHLETVTIAVSALSDSCLDQRDYVCCPVHIIRLKVCLKALPRFVLVRWSTSAIYLFEVLGC